MSLLQGVCLWAVIGVIVTAVDDHFTGWSRGVADECVEIGRRNGTAYLVLPTIICCTALLVMMWPWAIYMRARQWGE